MNTPPSILSRVLSIIVGVWVGAALGPLVFTVLFFFLFIIGVPIGIPIGVVLGSILGGLWGSRNPLTQTAFAAFGVWVGTLIFVLGEKLLDLPARAITWFAAPILGLAAMWLLPLLAKRLLSKAKREPAAIIAALVLLIAPLALMPLMRAFPDILPADPIQADSRSFARMTDFMMQGDAKALASLPTGRKSFAPRVTDKIAFLRQSVPEICCPGVRAPALKQEVAIGDWRIALHYLTTATLDTTVRYYEKVFNSKAVMLRQSDINASPTVWEVTGNIRGIAVSARIANIPQRGVCVVIF